MPSLPPAVRAGRSAGDVAETSRMRRPRRLRRRVPGAGLCTSERRSAHLGMGARLTGAGSDKLRKVCACGGLLVNPSRLIRPTESGDLVGDIERAGPRVRPPPRWAAGNARCGAPRAFLPGADRIARSPRWRRWSRLAGSDNAPDGIQPHAGSGARAQQRLDASGMKGTPRCEGDTRPLRAGNDGWGRGVVGGARRARLAGPAPAARALTSLTPPWQPGPRVASPRRRPAGRAGRTRRRGSRRDCSGTSPA